MHSQSMEYLLALSELLPFMCLFADYMVLDAMIALTTPLDQNEHDATVQTTPQFEMSQISGTHLRTYIKSIISVTIR